MIMTKFLLFKVSLFIGSFFAAYLYSLSRRKGYDWVGRLIYAAIAFYAAIQILLVLYLFSNHLNFPLNLEGLELIRLQHVRRALHGLPIFVEPTPEYVPLVYQPFYYYLTLPFIWLFGDKLSTLRLFSIVGTVGTGSMIFLIVKRGSNSTWFGFIAVGLFAAAYRVMDSYLDIASSDTWLIFSILLGCYLVNNRKSRPLQFLGMIFLILSFWIKQHGAIFVIAALLYLTWRDGWRKTLPFFVIAGILGPLLDYLAGPILFGSEFLFFTQEIPRQWAYFSWDSTVIRVLLISMNYIFLAVAGIAALMYQLRRDYHQIDIWYFILPFAILSGFLAAYIDPEGNNNVFIPLGMWYILTGTIAVSFLGRHILRLKHQEFHFLIIITSFVILMYNPKSVIIPPEAEGQYQELVSTLKSIDGSVYSPYTGPLEDEYVFFPTANWILMYDLVRGPGIQDDNQAILKGLLDPVQNPHGIAYILTDHPLETDPIIGYLAESYLREEDFEAKFSALKGLPMRYQILYPQYLYHHVTNR
jgi:hypothetical protein